MAKKRANYRNVTIDRLIHAAAGLHDAYERGEQRGGSIDWEDLDLAHEIALDALRMVEKDEGA